MVKIKIHPIHINFPGGGGITIGGGGGGAGGGSIIDNPVVPPIPVEPPINIPGIPDIPNWNPFNCQFHNPDYTNICSDYLGQVTTSTGFCTLAGNLGLPYRQTYCSNIGHSNEFDYAGIGDSCGYNDSTNNSMMTEGCCTSNGACGISGNKTKCRRKVFNADPLLCCLRDLKCNPDENNCFNNSNKDSTCAPEFRDQSSSACQNRLIEYCTGTDNPSQQEWINRWLGDVQIEGVTYNRPCYNSIYRNLYSEQASGCLNPPQPGIGVPTSSGFVYGQNLMNKMIQKYILEGGNLTSSEDSETNNELNDMIWNICNTTPGLCTNAISNYCVNITPDILVRNPSFLKWCGCYMSPDVYNKYTNVYGIPRECTPTCNMMGVIPLASNDGVTFKTCKQNVCIIDEISINIAKSVVGGSGINFNQICNSCTNPGNTGTCNCSITGSNFTILDSTTGGLQLNQYCSNDSVCYAEVTGPDGKTINQKVSCNGSIDFLDLEKLSLENRKIAEDNAIFRRNMIILGIFLFLIVLIFILWLCFYPEETTDKTKIIIKDQKNLKNTNNKNSEIEK